MSIEQLQLYADGRNAHDINTQHFVGGDRGCSPWTTVGTTTGGAKMELDGCALPVVVDGRIARKDSLAKKRR